MSKSNTVKLTLDLKNPPPLTAAQKKRLTALAAMTDDQIDTSDAPPMPAGTVWTKASVELPRTKRQITLRIDADVLEFFKHTGARYQSRMNAVLRSYVKTQQHKR